jgi:hypothetical protein
LGTLEGCTGTDVRLGSLSSRLSRAISDEGLERTCDTFAMTLRDHPAARGTSTTYEVRPGPLPLAMRRTRRTTGRCAAEDSARPAVHRSSHDAWTRRPRGPLHAVVDIGWTTSYQAHAPQLQLQLQRAEAPRPLQWCRWIVRILVHVPDATISGCRALHATKRVMRPSPQTAIVCCGEAAQKAAVRRPSDCRRAVL